MTLECEHDWIDKSDAPMPLRVCRKCRRGELKDDAGEWYFSEYIRQIFIDLLDQTDAASRAVDAWVKAGRDDDVAFDAVVESLADVHESADKLAHVATADRIVRGDDE